MIVYFDHLSETMEEDWSLNCGLHHLMVFFYCIKRGMYRLRLCLWLRFLWWWLRHNYWHTDDGVWAEVGVGWEVSWTVGCELVGLVGCTWVVMRDGEKGCDVVRSAGSEDKQSGASGWGSVCDAKLCYINECEFCFQAFTYFMVL